MKKITIGARGSKLSLAYASKSKKSYFRKSKDLNDRYSIKNNKNYWRYIILI